MEIDFLWHIS